MSDRIEQIRERLIAFHAKRPTGTYYGNDLRNARDVFLAAAPEDIAHLLSTVDALRGEVEEGRQALRGVLKHCDVKSEAETAFERDVIAARAYLAKGGN